MILLIIILILIIFLYMGLRISLSFEKTGSKLSAIIKINIFKKITVYNSSKEKTRILGKILCKQLLPGDIIFLVGDLGAGKSEFVRGIAEGLSIKDPIPSPSFTILNVYNNGSIPLNHFDWYRIGSDEELFEIGIDDFLFSDSISCIEWPNMSEYYFNTLKA